jgi:hypothetical protein
MKTLLMENGGIATSGTLAFVKAIDPNYKEYNTENSQYMRSDDLWVFAKLIQPELENIVTSSAFETNMNYDAYLSFDKNNNDTEFKQIEYFSYLFYWAVRYRNTHELKPLTFYINYKGFDFLSDLKQGILGDDTLTNVKRMFNHYEGYVTFHIYQDYELQHTLTKFEDLQLN